MKKLNPNVLSMSIGKEVVGNLACNVDFDTKTFDELAVFMRELFAERMSWLGLRRSRSSRAIMIRAGQLRTRICWTDVDFDTDDTGFSLLFHYSMGLYDTWMKLHRPVAAPRSRVGLKK